MLLFREDVFATFGGASKLLTPLILNAATGLFVCQTCLPAHALSTPKEMNFYMQYDLRIIDMPKTLKYHYYFIDQSYCAKHVMSSTIVVFVYFVDLFSPAKCRWQAC